MMSERTLSDCRQAATRTVDRLAARVKSDGSLGDDCQDLACFYKLPYLMQLVGHAAEAHRLLDYIRDRFLRPDGDFLTSNRIKTTDPVLALYPGYINGWITMAAHKLGRFDLSFPAWDYLRMAGAGRLETDFPAEVAALHVIAAEQPGQAWFFIGYPMAFLTRLFRATGEPRDLETARGYFDFAQRCAPRMFGEHFAHKVAWGAVELASVTGDASHWALGAEISRKLIVAQGREGIWMGDQPLHTRLDQSAEVAIWLLEIAARG